MQTTHVQACQWAIFAAQPKTPMALKVAQALLKRCESNPPSPSVMGPYRGLYSPFQNYVLNTTGPKAVTSIVTRELMIPLASVSLFGCGQPHSKSPSCESESAWGGHEFSHVWMKDDLSQAPAPMCEGDVCICCGGYPPHESPSNLVDGKPDTKTLLLALQLESQKYLGTFTITKPKSIDRVAGYTLTAAGDAHARDPSTWTLLGRGASTESRTGIAQTSADAEWIELDRQEKVQFGPQALTRYVMVASC